ncbi:hypothetical protein lerEdw1_003218 [Lerista edwardsae]|nr:hypothetical protein lerEdw1_003218 [Lerista edwardsae]
MKKGAIILSEDQVLLRWRRRNREAMSRPVVGTFSSRDVGSGTGSGFLSDEKKEKWKQSLSQEKSKAKRDPEGQLLVGLALSCAEPLGSVSWEDPLPSKMMLKLGKVLGRPPAQQDDAQAWPSIKTSAPPPHLHSPQPGLAYLSAPAEGLTGPGPAEVQALPYAPLSYTPSRAHRDGPVQSPPRIWGRKGSGGAKGSVSPSLTASGGPSGSRLIPDGGPLENGGESEVFGFTRSLERRSRDGRRGALRKLPETRRQLVAVEAGATPPVTSLALQFYKMASRENSLVELLVAAAAVASIGAAVVWCQAPLKTLQAQEESTDGENCRDSACSLEAIYENEPTKSPTTSKHVHIMEDPIGQLKPEGSQEEAIGMQSDNIPCVPEMTPSIPEMNPEADSDKIPPEIRVIWIRKPEDDIAYGAGDMEDET